MAARDRHARGGAFRRRVAATRAITRVAARARGFSEGGTSTDLMSLPLFWRPPRVMCTFPRFALFRGGSPHVVNRAHPRAATPFVPLPSTLPPSSVTRWFAPACGRCPPLARPPSTRVFSALWSPLVGRRAAPASTRGWAPTCFGWCRRRRSCFSRTRRSCGSSHRGRRRGRWPPLRQPPELTRRRATRRPRRPRHQRDGGDVVVREEGGRWVVGRAAAG